jgi:hypothetical protein
MRVDRRSLLQGASVLVAGAGLPRWASASPAASRSLPDFYAEIEKRTFQWFWDTANPKNGLVPDRWPTPSFSSIAAVGYALGAYAVGVERGWCRRADARERTLTTLRFFWNAPQGPDRAGVTGYKGFFYHFLDMETGERFRDVELSSVDTTILLMGVLFAGQYFGRDDAGEREIRDLSGKLYERADWNFFRSDGRAAVSMGWHPGEGLIPANWVGFNEGMFVNILALGSPTHPSPSNLWEQWTSRYADFWRGDGPTRHIGFAPLFGHQYSHIWIDFRDIRDAVMRKAGFDYFENSRRATYANWAWCSANQMHWRGYSTKLWGLTACDGPGDFQLKYNGETRQFFGYSARGPLTEPEGRDDGTIAPTAALGSLPFAPEIVLPCAEAMLKWPTLFDRYGFKDAFNASFTYSGLKVETGTVDATSGWVAKDYLGIDQGPILLQAANHRDDVIWRYMRRVPAIRRGLQRAGFTGGWLASGSAERG